MKGAELYICNVCGKQVSEGVESTFIFIIDVETFFICKFCLGKKIQKNKFMIRFLPEIIKSLLRKYGLYD